MQRAVSSPPLSLFLSVAFSSGVEKRKISFDEENSEMTDIGCPNKTRREDLLPLAHCNCIPGDRKEEFSSAALTTR